MESRPPSRPWFRMPFQLRTDTSRPQPQPQPVVPQPRPPLLRPGFVPALRQPTPQPPSQPQPAQPQAIAPTTAALPTQENQPPLSASLPPSPTAKTPPTPPSSPLPTSQAPKALSPPPPGPALLPTSPGPTYPRQPQPVEPSAIAPPTASLAARVSSESPKPKISTTSDSQPTSPARKVLPPPSSLPPTSAIPAAVHAPIPTQSPRIIRPSSQTPPLSPKTKPYAAPPSPLSLPPSQLAPVPEPKPLSLAEQKNELPQQESFKIIPAITSSAMKKDVHNGGKLKKDACKKTDSEDVGMRVLTIAGENKGAYMELGYFANKRENKGDRYVYRQHIHNSPKTLRDDKQSRSDDHKDQNKSANTMPTSTTAIGAFVNSNVQGANNSILLQCSCAQKDPGVHLNLSRKPASGQIIHLEERSNDQQS